jgi:hypothetical protein
MKIGMEKGEVKSFLAYEDFQPETYRLDFVADLVKFLNSKTGGLWLVKKANSNQGRGIQLISDIAAYKDNLLTKKEEEDSTNLFLEKMNSEMGKDSSSSTWPKQAPVEGEEGKEAVTEKKKWTNLNSMVKGMEKTIVQKYIERPLLLKNKKFDMRSFMFVACTKPYLVLFQSGYVRSSLKDYSLDDFSDKITHLTNSSVQKKHPDYA